MTSHQRNSRRGVTLLLVLGLMTMFAMLVTTFMVVTTQALRTAEITAQAVIEPKQDPFSSSANTALDPLLGRALDCLLVGGLDTVIGPHGVLENLYGNPVDVGGNSPSDTFGNVSDTAIDGLLVADNLPFNFFDPIVNGGSGDGNKYYLGDLCGYVLTVTDTSGSSGYSGSSDPDVVKKEAKLLENASTFVVQYNSGTSKNELVLAPFKNVALTPAQQAATLKGCEFIINSPPFGGTGPGYDDSVTAGARLTNGNGTFPWALRPNILAPENDGTQPYKRYLEDNLVMTNPDYTAPDYMNMFLAWADIRKPNGYYQVNRIIPSFHRPQLVNYWSSTIGTSSYSLRKIVLRPLRMDHPNFTGGNAAAIDPHAPGNSIADEIGFLINGPWDVDNDGDGIQDGIWLDLGFEPITIGGVTYKRLYSFYVVDLDGRLNVNTHGNLAHDGSFDTVTLPPEDKPNGSVAVRGAGSGAAEVRLDQGLDIVDSSVNVEKLMNSIETNRLGRYGKDQTPGDATKGDNDLPNNFKTSDLTANDNFTRNMGLWYGTYGAPKTTSGGNDPFKGLGGVVPDFWGFAPMLFDPLGNRRFDSQSDYFAKNPYLLNPYGDSEANDPNASDDVPFRYNDLEFLIRSVGDKNFMDVLSTTRLRELFGVDNHSDAHKFSKFRHFVTTRSSDIPMAGRAGLGGSKGLFERLMKICNDVDGDAKKLAALLPPELFRGERVSLDRIMFLEAAFAQGDIDDKELLKQKTRFAQEIFYLMMVLCHEEIDGGFSEGDLATPDVIARIAQWSVNLVDFLDADDIMTPFIFETDPLGTPTNLYDFTSSDFDDLYDGNWTPSGTDPRLIWGMEQPEVALTKTFATHNRRVADSKWGDNIDDAMTNRNRIHSIACEEDNCISSSSCPIHLKRMGTSTCTCETHKHDDSFDQIMVPQGSLFLELYRVGNPGRRDFPKNNGNDYEDNLHEIDSDENILDLGKVNGKKTPVWRLAIGKATKEKPGDPPDDERKKRDIFIALADTSGGSVNAYKYDFQPPQWTNDNNYPGVCEIELERFIWFGDTDFDDFPSSFPSGSPRDFKKCSYRNFGSPDGTADNVKLRPNEYLVIGPRVFTSFKSKPVKEQDDPSGTGGEDDITEFGTPYDDTDDAFNDYSINLKKLAEENAGSGGRCKVMIAAAPLDNISDNGYYVLGGELESGIGVSVSEPLPSDYYPVPDTLTDDMKASKEMAKQMEIGESKNFYDKYIGDKLCNMPLEKNSSYSDLFDFEQGFGTLTCFKAIFLQRLADPNREYHEVSNPYITVDWNMIDLHVFNSERDLNGRDSIPDDGGKGDSAMEYPSGSSAGAMDVLYFTMRQWGYTATTNTDDRRPNIWDRTFDKTKIESDEAGLVESGQGESEPKLKEDFVLGRLANIEDVEPLASGDYQGAPDKGFLHLPWNDGPLANTYELMMVPASSPSRFGFEFHESGKASTSWWKDAPSLGSEEMPISNEEYGIGPYFNFLFPGISGGQDSLHLARLFDFVRVPSRFNGTVRGFYTDADDVIKPVYEMREPGKINLNTANEAAWEALRSQSDPTGNSQGRYEDLLKVRGFDPTAAYPPSATYPSEFYKPFRSAQGGALVPTLTSGADDLVRSGAEMTPLRTDPTTSDPLFKPFKPNGNGEANQFTLLENVMRRSDMVTNRSNVFAVWVTVGYFEVDVFNSAAALNASPKYPMLTGISDPVFSAVYPHGCVLGEEKGLADGTVIRHRGFYIIDRTVPVGFRRGNTDLNSRNVIIHQRRLD